MTIYGFRYRVKATGRVGVLEYNTMQRMRYEQILWSPYIEILEEFIRTGETEEAA